MRTTVLTSQAFIGGLIIGVVFGDLLGLGSANIKSRTIETLKAIVATQRRTIETQNAIIATQEETIALLGDFGLDKTSPNAPLLAPNIYDN
ncbi:MAG: hypothetical protein IJ991_13245 [Thermoguttaceae bacterium]|nr:hypothetical protein [Thermoguttaceae bacterium]